MLVESFSFFSLSPPIPLASFVLLSSMQRAIARSRERCSGLLDRVLCSGPGFIGSVMPEPKRLPKVYIVRHGQTEWYVLEVDSAVTGKRPSCTGRRARRATFAPALQWMWCRISTMGIAEACLYVCSSLAKVAEW